MFYSSQSYHYTYTLIEIDLWSCNPNGRIVDKFNRKLKFRIKSGRKWVPLQRERKSTASCINSKEPIRKQQMIIKVSNPIYFYGQPQSKRYSHPTHDLDICWLIKKFERTKLETSVDFENTILKVTVFISSLESLNCILSLCHRISSTFFPFE